MNKWAPGSFSGRGLSALHLRKQKRVEDTGKFVTVLSLEI